MTTADTLVDDRPAPRTSIVAKSGHLPDRLFRLLCLAAGFMVLVILVGITATTAYKSLPVMQKEGLGFIAGARWVPSQNVYGALPHIYGTVVISFLALLLAVPCSLGIALFLTEGAPRRVRKPVVFLMDILAAVPSVVFGLWGVAVLQAYAPKLYSAIGGVAGMIPIFGPPYNGKSFATAGFILGLMITPIITSITREVIETTPEGQKHAALALGATRWEMIRGAILPHSTPGIVAAVLLGLGRAMGETIAAALVIGSAAQITPRIFSPGNALPAVIANEYGEATAFWQSALIGLGLILFVMTIVINFVARLVLRKGKEQ